MLVVLLILILVIIWILDYSIHGTRRGKLLAKLPGPKRLPVLGNLLEFFSTQEEMFVKIRHFSNKFKNTYIAWGVHLPFVNIINPEDFEMLLSSKKYITKSNTYEFLHPWLNTGLLTSSGDKWSTRRKFLTPAFHFNILTQFSETFKEESKKLAERLRLEVGKDQTEMLPYLKNYTLMTMCETVMGVKLNEISRSRLESYQNSIDEMCQVIYYRFIKLWLHLNVIFKNSTLYKVQTSNLDKLHDFTDNIIKERRELRNLPENENIKQFKEVDDNDVYVSSRKNKLAMLDLLLMVESNNQIDRYGIREEVDTFMFEGYDTTMTALNFCLMLLANNPEIQDRAAEEIKFVFENGNETEKFIDLLNKLEYVERCIKESLRLYPSVPLIGRYLEEDVQLKDFLIPGNVMLHFQIFDLHRRPDIFPDPEKYDPDRFLKENCKSRHPFAYLPFSAGPRNCIGQKFAMLEMKSVIASILKSFKLVAVTRPQDLIFQAGILLRTGTRIKVKIIDRN